MTSEQAREIHQYGYFAARKRERMRTIATWVARQALWIAYWSAWIWCVSNAGDAAWRAVLHVAVS